MRLQNEYDNATFLQGEHSYLKSKGIKADDLKIDEFNNPLIPLSDTTAKNVEILLDKLAIMAVDSGNLISVAKRCLKNIHRSTLSSLVWQIKH